MDWVWWQWLLAIAGGVVAFLVILVLVAFALLVSLIAINDAQEKSRIKRTSKYAIVVEKFPPTFVFEGPIGTNLTTYSLPPYGDCQPGCYELQLRVVYNLSDEDDDPTLGEIVYSSVVTREVYEAAVVGKYIENPLYVRDVRAHELSLEAVS